MAKTLIKPRELPIGRPLPWNIYDQDGSLMFARGVAIDPETKARIFKPGLLRDVNLEEGELVTERIKVAADEQAKEVRLAFSETGVRPGDAVHLVRDLDGTRLTARLIGYLKSKSIIISVPADEQGSIYLKAGESVVVKVFSGKHVLAFPCTVLAGVTNPFPHLHLSYPAEVTGIVVRKSARANVRLIAAVETGREQASGIIADLSTGGASLATRFRGIEIGARIAINFRVELAGCHYIMKIACQVKAIRANNSDLLEGAMVYGLQFCDLLAEDILILGQVVSQHQAEVGNA